MPLNVFFARKLRAAARFLVQPELIKLRLKGVDLNVYEKLSAPWLQELNIATVLDVGANEGHFAMAVHHALPQARIIAFEPLVDCFTQLQKRMAGVANFKGINLALGEESGTVSFQRSDFVASSSCLKMAPAHQNAFPHTQTGQTIRVEMDSLDHAVQQLDLQGPLLIKLDVQGYEDRVLRGGRETVNRAAVLIVETSFETLYKDQPLFAEIHSMLSQMGFSYTGSLDQMVHPKTGKPLQSDSVFIRRQSS